MPYFIACIKHIDKDIININKNLLINDKNSVKIKLIIIK